jgi:hypothetical protein
LDKGLSLGVEIDEKDFCLYKYKNMAADAVAPIKYGQYFLAYSIFLNY